MTQTGTVLDMPRLPTKRRGARIPDELWLAVQDKAAERGTDAATVIRGILHRYLENPPAKTVQALPGSGTATNRTFYAPDHLWDPAMRQGDERGESLTSVIVAGLAQYVKHGRT